MAKYKLLIRSARQVVQVTNTGARALYGADMQLVAVLESDVEGHSVVVGLDGKISDIGPDSEILDKYRDADFTTVINASGRCVMPGLVDAHTHPVWAGDRVHEFAMKLAGASYMEVHNAGGGIHFTVDHTRRATEEELLQSFCGRLRAMVRFGTTLVECKSGYGLDTDSELKMLRVIDKGRQSVSIDVSSTYCGAHAVPKGRTAAEATDDVIKRQLPAIQKLITSGELHVDNIDVFCEKGVFDVTQSRDILLAGKAAGLQVNFHGDELHCLNSAEMGADIGALAISHLEEVSRDGIGAMATSGTVAVILPTTAYILRLSPPPVRQMITEGVAVALGSDFNPNAYCLSMPMVMHLACVNLRMSMPEVLCAGTINAAAALGKSSSHGSIEVGKVANLLVLDAHRWEHLIYQFGCSDVIEHVIWHGDVVHSKSKPSTS
ncbi:probable imidazolonepropionase [Haliotis cracherodii]|uniref:probable imidazolonepropionase n=1 Tax=Haliotis cracherodii TaxID=6455 RepID=UPI0039EAD02B